MIQMLGVAVTQSTRLRADLEGLNRKIITLKASMEGEIMVQRKD